jgi:hypothetical protein
MRTIPVWYIRSAVEAFFFFSQMLFQLRVLLKLMKIGFNKTRYLFQFNSVSLSRHTSL